MPRAALIVLLTAILVSAHSTLAAPLAVQKSREPDSTTSAVAFVGVHVVDVEGGRVLRNQTVVVDDGVFRAVAHRDSATIPLDVTVIDGNGRFLIPGLIDLHSHPIDPTLLPLYVAYGVTTVQMLNAPADVLQWESESLRDGAATPRLEACAGPIRDVETATEARRIASAHQATGFRCLKPYDALTGEAYLALLDEARHRGMRSVSHIPRGLRWQEVLAARPNAIAHVEEFLYSPIESAADLDTLVATLRRADIGLVTTLVNYDLISRQRVQLRRLSRRGELAFIPAVERRSWMPPLNRYLRAIPTERVPQMRRLLDFQRDLVRRVHDAGGTILLGTDAGNSFVVPGISVHDELVQLVAAGLAPGAALAAATVDAARSMGAERGRIAAGYAADAVLVLGDPLSDITSTSLIAGTLLRGQWYDAKLLDAMLDTLVAQLAVEDRMVAQLETRGLDAMLDWIAAQPNARELRPRALDELGHQLWKLEDRLDDAVRVFELNARRHPDWPGAAASLREAQRAAAASGKPAP